jgi:hypothetical protein
MIFSYSAGIKELMSVYLFTTSQFLIHNYLNASDMKEERRWLFWYAFVIVWLALLIGGFYLFTKVFS